MQTYNSADGQNVNICGPLSAYAISLRDEGFFRTEKLFRNVPLVELVRSPGVLVSDLPHLARTMITRSTGSDMIGALGCFLAHVAVWEKIVRSGKWSLIVEDDVKPCALERLFKVDIPDDAEIVWVNRRMNYPPQDSSPQDNGADSSEIPAALPARNVLAYKAAKWRSPGTDGYLLSAGGAGKLIDAVRQDGMYGHLDWRLLRYAVSRDDVLRVCEGNWMRGATALRPDNDRWSWNVVTGYHLTPHLISHRADQQSARKKLDESNF